MNTNSKTYIVFDMSNMLYRSFYANKAHDAEESAGLAHHTALIVLNKYFKLYKPHKVIMTFDRHSWRKDYTADKELCVSGKKYKGNRRQKMSPKDKEKYAKFLDHLREFEEIMRIHTSVICLAEDGLEADDLMAGFVQMHPDDNIIVVSGDKDMIQLLRHQNTQLIDPATGKNRTLGDWNGDADLFMFEKCLRGDPGDNVSSAFPRIRSKKIHEAYTNAFLKVNIMNDTWTDHTGKEQIVRHIYAENQILMNLEMQPECVRRKMITNILRELKNPGEFSYFHFLKFCGKYELKKIIKSIEQFIPMLSR